MGLFSNVRNAFAITLEARRGESLAEEMKTTMNNLSKADPDLLLAVFEVFKKKRAELMAQKASWPTAKQLEIGRDLRIASEKMSRYAVNNSNDEAASYGLWLAGAWLESGASNSVPAQAAHFVLEETVNPARR